MRNKLFYILYAIIVIVLFIAILYIDNLVNIPFTGAVLGWCMGLALSKGLIRELVEYIIDIFEDDYYLD